jgi:hypothetical protein
VENSGYGCIGMKDAESEKFILRKGAKPKSVEYTEKTEAIRWRIKSYLCFVNCKLEQGTLYNPMRYHLLMDAVSYTNFAPEMNTLEDNLHKNSIRGIINLKVGVII